MLNSVNSSIDISKLKEIIEKIVLVNNYNSKLDSCYHQFYGSLYHISYNDKLLKLRYEYFYCKPRDKDGSDFPTSFIGTDTESFEYSFDDDVYEIIDILALFLKFFEIELDVYELENEQLKELKTLFEEKVG